MIWMLYYVVGFWISFGLVVVQSALRSENADGKSKKETSSVFAALVIAMAWPICLPVLAVLKVLDLTGKREIKTDDNGSGSHGFPTI